MNTRSPDPYTGRQLSGVAALKEIATRQARAARPPYLGPRTGDQLTALRTLERIADKNGAAVTQPFQITDSAIMRLPRITVLIPAHNEAATIAQTLRSLWNQTMPVASVTVICDNCTDDTAAVAAAEGAYVCPAWLEAGAWVLAADSRVGAVCGAFLGEPGGGIVGQIQRNEFFRYARIVKRRWQALVLSGTGTLFRVSTLREIGRERGRRLPGMPGQFYSQRSITEDDEITLAVKTLGFRCLCPPECETITEVMPDWGALWTQRMRWQKGTLGDLSSYGLTRVTCWYWMRQAGLYGGFAISYACLFIMIGALLTAPG